MAIWPASHVVDVSESVGVQNLSPAVSSKLAADVEYRLNQIIIEAMKFMRHSKRTHLSVSDISYALRVLDVEPLYGYDTNRRVKFGAASLGPGQPVYYLDEEEVDFEKLINAPLPRVPREVSITAHWMAIEGVQPAIPQNPSQVDVGRQGADPTKGSTVAHSTAAVAGMQDKVTVKPLVKHILSKELQLYFEKVCAAVLDENNDNLRHAALSSLRHDSGLHQLLPYFVQFVGEKVTHNLRNLSVLSAMMDLVGALLENPDLFIDPYVSSLVPPILTCLVGRRLGDSSNAHYSLRDLAASLLALVAKRFGESSHTLKPRLMRTCLKHFLEPGKSLGCHYGAILGLAAIGGTEAVRVTIIPNLKIFDKVLEEGGNRDDADKCVEAVGRALGILGGRGGEPSEEEKDKLRDLIGDRFAAEAERVGGGELMKQILEVKEMKV